MYKYNKTIHKTVNGQSIYLQVCSITGIERYKVKSRSTVLKPKGNLYKVSFVPSWRNLDPVENEQLFNEQPMRFSGYIHGLLREEMINNRQTWDERQLIEA